jgi:hypothetical protein
MGIRFVWIVVLICACKHFNVATASSMPTTTSHEMRFRRRRRSQVGGCVRKRNTNLPSQLYHGTKSAGLVLKPVHPTWFAVDIEYSYQICAIAAFQALKPTTNKQPDFQCHVYSYTPIISVNEGRLSSSLDCPTTADAIQTINEITKESFPGPSAAMPEAKAICQHVSGGYRIQEDHANGKEEWMLCSASNHVTQQADTIVPCKYKISGRPGSTERSILVCPPAPCTDSYTWTSGGVWTKNTGVREGC